MGVVVLLAFVVVLSAVALCVVLPPWTSALLIAAVLAIEWSPFLFVVNLLTLAIAMLTLRHAKRWLAAGLLVINLGLTALPVVLLLRNASSLPAIDMKVAPKQQRAVRERDISLRLRRSTMAIRAYLPETGGRHAMIFAIYGGAWRHGSAANDAALNRRLAELGYAVFALDYRHSPRYRFPAALRDIRDEMRLLVSDAARYDADPNRLALIGHSSGGELALLAGLGGGDRMKAVVSYSGPIDLTGSYERPPQPDPLRVRAILREFVGGPPADAARRYDAASPLHNVGMRPPPVLLIYGGRDHVVEVGQADELRRTLQSRHAAVTTLFLPWAEHGFEAVPLGLHARIAWSVLVDFLRDHDPA